MFGLEKYDYTANKSFRVYSFFSTGPQGKILKIAKFTLLGPNLYNFGFGDYNEDSNMISDLSRSNNGDTDIILNTLGSIVYDFTSLNPKASIFVQGSDSIRTRLYQINIRKHLDRIASIFYVFGRIGNEWEFIRKGVNYDAFMVLRE